MDTKFCYANFFRAMCIMVFLAAFLPATGSALAANATPFVGHWQAIDPIDGSEVQMIIAGPPNGPFNITQTDSYISFCDGGPGIIRGEGWVNELDSYMLEADLHIECFTTGAALDFHWVWLYHPSTNTLTNMWNGKVFIWFKSGPPQAPAQLLELRINYGHDWVESFYEAGHTSWVTVTESDGRTVKASIEVYTEPKEYWDWETGFQSMDAVWVDSEGYPMEYPPDIQPYDWVYGWMDNGATALVQIGEISGFIDFESDTIRGTVDALWFSGDEKITIECHPWGAPEPLEVIYAAVKPNGEDEYSCSWSPDWEFNLGQDIGVGYMGPDGHWVANAFSPSWAQIHASVTGDFFFATDFNPGILNIAIYESAQEGAALLWNSEIETDETGFVHISPDVHGLDLIPGNYLVISDGKILKGLSLELISLDFFDTQHEIMVGIAPAGSEVMVVAAPGPESEVQAVLNVIADLETGDWLADFSSIEFDITQEMREWSFASISDVDGDKNETSWPPNTRFTVFPEWNYLEGYEWPDGEDVSISVAGKCSFTAAPYFPEWDPGNTFFGVNFPEDCVIEFGDQVTLSSGVFSLTHHIPEELTITNVNLDDDTVTGTAIFDSEYYYLHTWIHEIEESYMQLSAEGGVWLADFGSLEIDLQPEMGGRVEVVDQNSNATAVDWWIPNPVMTIFPESEYFQGYDWPYGVTVNITVGENEACTTERESWGDFFDGNFPEGCDIAAGDEITFDDGTTTRTHLVRSLAITGVDETSDIITGTADIGEKVSVGAYDFGGDFEIWLTVEDGTWQADFTTKEVDLVGGMYGYSRIFDEVGNWTQVDWYIPHTRFTVWPEWNYLEGYEWPDGAVVSISVAGEGNEICSTETVSGFPEWDPWNTFFGVSFPEGCVIEAGDVITLSTDSLNLTHQVQNLAITEVDLDLETVAGTAVFDPEQYILHTWIHEVEESYMQLSAEGGAWLADFGSLEIHLQPGMGGRVEVIDQNSNATAVEWRIPNPVMTIFPEWEWFDGMDWPDGAMVSITVDGKSNCTTTGGPSWDGFFSDGFPEGCDVAVGDEVTFTYEDTVRTHVVRDVAITTVDKDADVVTGTAEIGSLVYAWVHGYGYDMQLEVTDGTWFADFGSAGLELVENMGGRAEIRDDFGNSTASDWWIPNPHFTILPEFRRFEGFEWPNGAEVNITLDGMSECETVGYDSFFDVYYSEECVIEVGDEITFYDGETTRTHIVQDLTVTSVDKVANVVYGTTETGSLVYAWVHGYGYDMEIEVAEDGTWEADFGSAGLDLVEGMGGRVEIRDEFGNATGVDWGIPNPPRLAAYLEQEFVIGWDWPHDANLTMTIDDPSNGTGVDLEQTTKVVVTPFSPDIWWAFFELPEGYDLKPGDLVVLTDGDTTREHVVLPLTVDAINADVDTVAGTSPSDAWVYAHPWEVTFDPIQADFEGYWQMSFAELYDLQPGTNGIAEIFDDDGDSTAIDWQVLPSYIFAYPAYELIQGVGWIPGTDVMVAVDDPTNGEGADYLNNQIVDNDGWLHFWLTGYDLQAGNIITMTDGRNTRMMVVSNLRVTGFNLDAHTVYGIGDPDSEFFIADNRMTVPVSGDGNWSATFDDLAPGSWWTIIQPDLNGNEVRETFRSPLPAMVAWKQWDDVAGSEWTPGNTVTLTIDDPANGQGVDFTFTQPVVETDTLYYGDVYFDLGDNFELQTGYVLTMSDGNFTKTLVISALTVTGFDFENHIIYGTGDPGASLFVHLGGLESEWTTVGEDQNWSVYHELLAPDVWFDAIQPDEDGDQTRDGGQA